jgi:predicted Zn-dependent peptidase
MFAPFALAAQLAGHDPSIPFEKYQLPNGLTVILSEDHRLPQVAVDVWYHVGAANQVPGKSGFAHLFEHMMFSGAKHIGPQPFAVLESIGGGEQANGTTSEDRTNYFEVVPSAELPTALWLESDRMGFLLDTLDAKKLDVQRDVVSNERRQSYENRPYGTAELRVCDIFFPKPHPYYDCVIGTIAEIQSASMDDLKGFFRQYYAPNNASISIVGNFDPAQAKALVEKYFGPIPRQADVAIPSVAQPPLPGVVKETLQDQVAKIPRLEIAWVGVKSFDPDEAAGDVLARILAAGKASRLYQALVHDKQIAADVSADDEANRLGGVFSVAATMKDGHSTQEAAPAIDAILDAVRQNGVTDDEVDRAKRVIVADHLRRLERIGGFGGKADMLGYYEMFQGDPGYLAKDLARYRAVTADAVKAFANKYLLTNQRLILDIQPAGGNSAAPGSKGGK